MTATDLPSLLAGLESKDLSQLRLVWRNHLGGTFPKHFPKWLLARVLAYRLQARIHGDLDAKMLKKLRQGEGKTGVGGKRKPVSNGAVLTPGTVLIREWQGRQERVTVCADGFSWNGKTWTSLSQVAKAITGTNWNGHRFFGLQRKSREKAS